ncbi:uncharacterized protein LOC143230655 [Tachypleus tridentatus]|uniref:uncharacterized protein LOC143230655 n=1 Tax=Tachypleus tridentatus TaxID=6853 RepID=UPI003FD0D268
MGRRAGASLLTTFIVQFAVLQVSASGVFEFRLEAFSNDYGRDFEGNCCRGYRTSHGLCSGVCQTSFRVCLKHYQATINPNPPCTFGEVISPVLGNNSVHLLDNVVPGFINPVRFSFEFSWPGTFSLIVEAWHESSGHEGGGQTLVSRLATQRWLDVKPEWTQDSHRTDHTAMTYSYRVLCEDNYYGKACAKLCRPRNDKFGHYSCSSEGDKVCVPGWSGEYCTKAICLPGCHEQNGHCDQPNECKCRLGWEGPMCEKCTRYPNCVYGTCTQPWQCNCEEGWGGLLCNQDLNYCTNHKPCKNGGTCTNTGQGSYTCACVEGTTGSNCEVHENGCVRTQCDNGGICKRINKSYRCECPQGFHGNHCEKPTNRCSNNKCENGGTCKTGIAGNFCVCPGGFSGDRCEMQPNKCEPNPCHNGGSCVQRVQSHMCICPTGFTGDQCDIDINDCVENPCLNGGSCVDDINSFRCSCVPGFMGSLCQTNVDDCLIKPCANGGICHDLINDFRCDCQPGFTSKDCSVEINECHSNPCQNGGTCMDRVNEIVCLCPYGFNGVLCEEDEDTGVKLHTLKLSYNESVEVPQSAPPTTAIEVSHHVLDNGKQSRLSVNQITLTATFSTVVPLVSFVGVLLILFLRNRKRQRKLHEAEEIQKQNEQSTVKSMNNKFLESKIINTLDKPSQKSLNISSEGQDLFAAVKGHESMSRTKSNKYLNTDCNSSQKPDTDSDKQFSSSQRTLERRGSVHSTSATLSTVNKSDSLSSCPHSSVYIIGDEYRQEELNVEMLATEV